MTGTTTTPSRHRRRLGSAAAAAVAAVLAVSLLTLAPYTAEPASTTPWTGSGAITLSTSVRPGEPVPLELITRKSRGELADKGFLGQGIDVALIDSGVTPVAGLAAPGKLIHGPDLSNEGGLANLANLDTFGHGTHLAGIIAGDDGAAVGGIAPASRIVSVKVAGATGETDIAQVIAAIDWVVEHKNDNGLDIRVLNISLGVAGVSSNVGDPLSAAVERAWRAGIVVVAAAGNRGNDAGGIDSPAVSPYVIAVGAIESFDSSGKGDKVAPWSSGGNKDRQPDVVAPGRSIMSYRVPGSMLDQMHPNAVVGDTYFLGSGTSQAAAVVSGFAAALLSRDPSLTPDEVKFLFTSKAADVAKGKQLDGAGKLRAKEAARETKNAHKAPQQSHPTADGTSTGVVGMTGASWSGGTWNGASWSGGTWSGASWSGASWSGASWSAGVWSGASWSSASWSGASWSGASWSGASWSGASWSGASWSGASWSGASWLAEGWS